MFKKISVKVTVYVNVLLLIVMVVGAWFIVSQQSRHLEQQLLERGKIEAVLGARFTGRILEEAIDNGVFSVKDAFDTEYEEIPGFEPAKYHTRYDFYLDKALLAIEDEFLKDESVVFAVAVDVNGYLPTHNTLYQQPITGDVEKDKTGNRTKRIFNDSVGLSAAQNLEEGFLQVYARDTGETMWDISAPIIVKGKHWGGFRIGFSLAKVNQQKMVLQQSLMIMLMAILVISIVAVVVTVGRALKPLETLTQAASDLADGKVDEVITAESTDEVGKLADALERLRVSLKAAMDRLRKKNS
ncbi:HAMP domain-containing protein [Desulfuromonas acetoxidans]|uniref:histidine kinase n=1 Tax=Desulfuromonas acetoxidans (strain DSM 684 / 11070) TaxID=281689 RepID=Q1JZ21_DESA6|nr:HAMP domain-containing protein [Desulfuromonas acetoxidans]EAT15473.1 putative methyl-accepting chemotaxis sensory transducer [Desulfuromonas acetoxidans DSM 684]MBF0646658.1 HAMP domain-containing protein [Desulfuromonas acetoxidans]NVD25761.1 HAMP domain-containing protein [Desulfuromonas acetoxidans]NVE17739.1 HAMP domain-containing protein [Desulfuromonas acetoxidans]